MMVPITLAKGIVSIFSFSESDDRHWDLDKIKWPPKGVFTGLKFNIPNFCTTFSK